MQTVVDQGFPEIDWVPVEVGDDALAAAAARYVRRRARDEDDCDLICAMLGITGESA